MLPFYSEYQEDDLKWHKRALRIAYSYEIPLNDWNTNQNNQKCYNQDVTCDS